MNSEHCMRCTICVENCPVMRANPNYPGPKQAGPDAERFRSDRDRAEDEWVLLCSQCKRCEMACPCGVEPSQIILRAQQRYGMEHPHSLAHLLFANNFYLSTLGSLTAPFANIFASTKVGKKIFGAMHISTYIPFPKFRFNKLSWKKKTPNRRSRKVAFFYGCFINFYRPDIGRKIFNLLKSFKVDVVLPPQWCCGLPALGNGNLELARKFAMKNTNSLSNYVHAGYDIVYSCTSCGLCLLRDYQGIMDIPKAKIIAENTYNLHEYILKLIDENYIKPEFKEVPRNLAYHIPCHLRALGIGYPAAKLMSMIPGLTYDIHDENCCGLSGSYGFKKSNEATAIAIGNRAVTRIKKTEANAIMSDCGSCRMQLGGLSGLTTIDPSEILCESLGITLEEKQYTATSPGGSRRAAR